MNGSKLLLYTNIVIYLLSGDSTLAEILNKKHVYLSFISQLELLRYKGLSSKEQMLVKDFLSQSTIVDINQEIKEHVIQLSKNNKLKLPDSIILATALYLDIPLISSDKDLTKVDGINILYYER